MKKGSNAPLLSNSLFYYLQSSGVRYSPDACQVANLTSLFVFNANLLLLLMFFTLFVFMLLFHFFLKGIPFLRLIRIKYSRKL